LVGVGGGGGGGGAVEGEGGFPFANYRVWRLGVVLVVIR
jgi:hypothetical protein